MAQILDTDEKLNELLAAPIAAVYKWSPVCGVSALVQRVINRIEQEHPDIPIYRVDVIGQRSLSNRLAELLGVEHESPQILLLRSGRAVYDESHWNISSKAFTKSVAASGPQEN